MYELMELVPLCKRSLTTCVLLCAGKFHIPNWMRKAIIIQGLLTIVHGLTYCVLAVVLVRAGTDHENHPKLASGFEYGIVFLLECPAYVLYASLRAFVSATRCTARHPCLCCRPAMPS